MPRVTNTRERLLTTAGTLFYERGIAATGVDAVVRESGVSKPTLYAQFHSKSELVAAVLRQRHDDRAAQLQAWVGGVEDPFERPLAVFAWLEDFYRRAGTRGCAFLNAAAELRDPDDAARRVVRDEKRWLLDYLAALARDASLHEPDRLASQLLLLVDGVAGRVVASGAAAAPGAVADASGAARTLIDASSAKR
ncbi:MAG: hypothetical protein QOJ46_1443 [bacterium]|jgi:AcrR family transcriptional regulator